MKELLHSTTAYRQLLSDARAGTAAHTSLVIFPDEGYLRALLKECAKAFFLAEEGSRVAALIEKESFADCLILPQEGEKITVELAAQVIDESLLRSVEGGNKLFVLDRFHLAAPLVQNKLLKVLEEPPAGVYFLLGATAEHSVLPTVLSRAKKFAVPPFTEKQIEDALRRGHDRESGVREAAAASGGIYSVAEDLLSGGGEDFRLAEQFLAGENVEALCRAVGERKEKRSFFAALKLVLRDLMFLSAGQARYCARTTEEMKRLAKKYPAGVILSAIGFVTEAEKEIGFNANPGQAAFAVRLRMQKELEKWQKLL